MYIGDSKGIIVAAIVITTAYNIYWAHVLEHLLSVLNLSICLDPMLLGVFIITPIFAVEETRSIVCQRLHNY